MLRYTERVPGYKFRVRELRPLPGEARRWLVVLNGKPFCIKHHVRHFMDVARYRGFGMSTIEAVFVWTNHPLARPRA